MARTQQLCRSAVAALFPLPFNASSIAIILLLLSVATLPAAAGTWNAFGPKTYFRGDGSPVTVTDTFSVRNPSTIYTLHLVNGGLVDATYENVGQTVITLNGVVVVAQNQFTQNTTTLDLPVTLQLSNQLDIQVRGKPGGALSLQIIGVDNDPPLISAALSPAANGAGWNRSAVTVTFACDDLTSGIAICPTSVTVNTEGANEPIAGTASDLAGNTATANVQVSLDKTPPVVIASAFPAPNAAGWNNADVSLTYTCTDALSGIAACPAATTLTAEGSSQIASGAATDNAGNTATTTTTVQIDKTPPIVTISSPANGAVFASSSITLAGTVSDSLSGIAGATCNGAPASFAGGSVTCPVTLLSGANPITISAQDAAGNFASQTVTVQLQSGPVISGISPTDGPVGTTIVVSGSGFGPTPTSDALIMIGSIIVTPATWSDTSISFVVPATSAGGVVSVSIGGTTMTGPTFTVSGRSTSPTVFLSPSQLSLVVGDTYTPDAFDTSGVVLHGLPWSSSDLTIIELSSDDPPVLIAKAAGTATITAGTATSTITVYPGPTLPVGTVKWKVPDDGRGVRQIIPAVPSATGVADVFTVTNTGHVQAITPDGHIAWTVWPYGSTVPDFQGGFMDVGNRIGGVIQKYDGITGQAGQAYTLQGRTGGIAAVHTDGTVFALEVEINSILVLNPLTGQAKAHVPMQTGIKTITNDCPGAVPQAPKIVNANWWVKRLTIAGDGYFYFNYIRESDSSNTHCEETDAAGVSAGHKLALSVLSRSRDAFAAG